MIKGMLWIVATIVVGIVALVRHFEEAGREQARLEIVAQRYIGETAVLIADKKFWPGQTAEQLHDSLGPPEAVETVFLKSRKREVWKYGNDGVNRYRTRITLDDDVVTRWTTR